MKINIRCKRLAAGLTVFAGLALAAGPAMGQVTNLSTDVAQAIDDGLAQLDAWGAYSYPGCSAGDATITGMSMERPVTRA